MKFYFILRLLFAVNLANGAIVTLPDNYTALSGDLQIHLQDLTPGKGYYVQLLESYAGDDSSYTIVSSTPVRVTHSNPGVAKTSFACGLVTQGGKFFVKVGAESYNDVAVIDEDDGGGGDGDGDDDDVSLKRLIKGPRAEVTNATLHVRWPSVSLTLEPGEIETYPETNVTATIMFSASYCEPAVGSLIPETWLSLIYCGHSIVECKLDNSTLPAQILYSEQIRGYPTLKVVHLDCYLFGMAGYYTLVLSSGKYATGTIISKDQPSLHHLRAVWSEKFVFNVHARSIYRCDGHAGGVAVLFQYPPCILSNDRIRLYGRERSLEAGSSLPSTSLHYVTEQKVLKGKHSMFFDCDLFSEKYVEYCFVYVSQSINGAVSDVRTDCVPTFPQSDKDSGGWGKWSEWTECSTNCKGGTRNRYRFCDSPTPKYGGKFCEGHALETEECGNITSLECKLYESKISPKLLAANPGIQDEIGPGCECGCTIRLNSVKRARLLAASTLNCDKKATWLVQAEDGHVIQLHMDQAHLPCSAQKLKIHDGPLATSDLLAQFTSTGNSLSNSSFASTKSELLVEFFTANKTDPFCAGAFLCHIQQTDTAWSNASLVRPRDINIEISVEAVHVAIILTLAIAVCMSFCMAVQYVNRYNKYERTPIYDDTTDDVSDTYSKKNLPSLQTSQSTLISEMIPMHNIRKNENPIRRIWLNKCAEIETKLENEGEKRESKYENGEEGKFQIAIPDPGIRLESPEGDAHSVDENYRQKNLEQIRRPSNGTPNSITSSISGISSTNSSLKGSTLKRVKDLRNQEKMMARSDSSLMTGTDVDFEMDYYDYNVQNTNEIPGSFLGMDPAYCLWIPPIEQWRERRSCDDEEENESLEMRPLKGEKSEGDASWADDIPEKFERDSVEFEGQGEDYKRFSSISTSSSRTVVADDMKGSPGSVKFVVKRDEGEIKFADDSDEC